MGVFHSCPFAEYSDVETGLESVIVKSISFGDEEVKTPVRSISFKGEDMEPTILKSLGSGKMIIEGSVSFKESELEAIISRTSSLSDKQKDESSTLSREKSSEMENQSPLSANSMAKLPQSPLFDPNNPKHLAAIKLQKVYKSFRTRRKLADCAVLVEQSWWKLLDFAELKRSSISFFDIEKHETAISRWSRAKNRAAKVGKGLSKNDKAQKLALQHWLEAIDPRHRYGHNLHFYYEEWLHSKSREPFFYWLDIGEGREVNLVNKCPRLKLHQQCIKYLGPMERMAYEVIVKDGRFFYKQTGEVLHTLGDIEAKWIFVLSASKTLYVGKKKKGAFQHSSFLAGGATTAAGRLVVENGKLKAVWPHSGHYRPTEENFKDFISFLEENNVDLTDVKMSPEEDDESVDGKPRSSMHIRNHSSEDDLAQALHGLENDEINVQDLSEEKTGSMEHKTPALLQFPNSERFHGFSRKLANLEIPNTSELFVRLGSDNPACNVSVESQVNGSHSAEEAFASEQNDMVRNQKSDEEEEEAIPKEAILQRINSHKETKSYQLGRQLSSKWTTGAGPRIGCVRDYPSKLQFQALEKVNLSPRSACLLRSKLCCTPHSTGCVSPNVYSPTSSGMTLEATTRNVSLPERGNLLTRNIQLLRAQSSPLQGQQSPNLLQPNSS